MNLGQWIAAKFGAQYVMLRCGHQLTFRIKRAYRIGGRWYTHTYHNKDRDCPSDSGSVIPKGHAYYMLTDTTRLTKAKVWTPVQWLCPTNCGFPSPKKSMQESGCMSKWRELKYYCHGTPTKTSLKNRRRHLFRKYVSHHVLGSEHSPCGLHVFPHRFSEGPTGIQKCGHCVRAVRRR